MKVLAKIESGKFLCEVSDYELRKFMKTFGNFSMDVGQDINLAEGYEFAQDAINAMRETQSFISSNQKIIETIAKGINIFSDTENEEKIEFVKYLNKKSKQFKSETEITNNKFNEGYFEGKAEVLLQVAEAILSGFIPLDESK